MHTTGSPPTCSRTCRHGPAEAPAVRLGGVGESLGLDFPVRLSGGRGPANPEDSVCKLWACTFQTANSDVSVSTLDVSVPPLPTHPARQEDDSDIPGDFDIPGNSDIPDDSASFARTFLNKYFCPFG